MLLFFVVFIRSQLRELEIELSGRVEPSAPGSVLRPPPSTKQKNRSQLKMVFRTYTKFITYLCVYIIYYYNKLYIYNGGGVVPLAHAHACKSQGTSMVI